jgi:methionyl-tRNA synthetase
MVTRYFDGVVPDPEGHLGEADQAIRDTLRTATQGAMQAMEKFAIHEAIQSIWTIVDELNGYLTEQEPWVLAKSDDTRGRLAAVLYTAADGLRALAVLLSPVMPAATHKLWTALNAEEKLGPLEAQLLSEAGKSGVLSVGTAVGTLEPLFPRIESEA